MGAPYTSVSVSGYNSNPPADDGSQTEANRVKWSTIKTKLGDPLNSYASAQSSAILSAFAKVIGGGGVTSSAISYQILATDQGKFVQATGAGGTTFTTPDATNVGSPFVFMFINNASSAVTFDGSGSQTIDGVASRSVPPNTGFLCGTDGANWFTTGLVGTLAGAQLGYGDVINGTIAESNGSNAVTFSLKTLAGTDPSTADPVLICFRNATLATGNYVYRTVTAALSLTISSGSTLGASNNTAFKVWLVLFDDAGTIRLGAINCVSGTNIFCLGQPLRASSTAEGGAGGADSAQTFYTGTAVSAKPYIILGFAIYESGLATAGSWNVSPTRIQLYGPGVPLPGQSIQVQQNATGAMATGATTVPVDNTIPQNTEGDQYLSQAITPTSAANMLRVESRGYLSFNADAAASELMWSLYQDTTANALAVTSNTLSGANTWTELNIDHWLLAGTSSATTFKMRGGCVSGGTTTFNGSASTQLFGGTFNSFLRATEYMT